MSECSHTKKVIVKDPDMDLLFCELCYERLDEEDYTDEVAISLHCDTCTYGMVLEPISDNVRIDTDE